MKIFFTVLVGVLLYATPSFATDSAVRSVASIQEVQSGWFDTSDLNIDNFIEDTDKVSVISDEELEKFLYSDED